MKYIDEILDVIIKASQNSENTGPFGLSLFDLFKVACEEIEKLEVNDFPPDKRSKYTFIRQKYRKLGRMSGYTGDQLKEFINLTTEIKSMLSNYGQTGSDLNIRSFSFILDPDLKDIIIRDYFELNSILIPDKAWKSSVVLAGSILEAILFDVLENPKFYQDAMASTKAPKNTSGTVIDIKTKDWKLCKLIEVAVDINLLPESRGDSIDQILRDFRNFVHPKKEIRTQYPCTEAEAFLAKGALDSVLNHLETFV